MVWGESDGCVVRYVGRAHQHTTRTVNAKSIDSENLYENQCTQQSSFATDIMASNARETTKPGGLKHTSQRSGDIANGDGPVLFLH